VIKYFCDRFSGFVGGYCDNAESYGELSFDERGDIFHESRKIVLFAEIQYKYRMMHIFPHCV
jgi:hypothetical protein